MLRVKGRNQKTGERGTAFYGHTLFISSYKRFSKHCYYEQTEEWISKLLMKFLGISVYVYQLFSYKNYLSKDIRKSILVPN